jgi:hypothetical protein
MNTQHTPHTLDGQRTPHLPHALQAASLHESRQGWLTAGDRVTVALWERSYRHLHAGSLPDDAGASGPSGASGAPDATGMPQTGATVRLPAWLAATAVHAVLAGLRRSADAAALLATYADSAAAGSDFALNDSIVPAASSDPRDPLHQNDERRWQVRDAAFHVRWLELAQGGWSAQTTPAPAARERCGL